MHKKKSYFNAVLPVMRSIYKPKYIALNLFLAVAYYGLFLYLAYVQGGGAVMVRTSGFLIFGLVATSSIALTIAIYSIKNTIRNNAKTSGTATSFATLASGTGLCGCTTTFPAVVATAAGISSPNVLTFISFLKNYNPYIFGALIIFNLAAIGYYLNKFSEPICKVKTK
ncbi:MAG: hypothetical protein KGH65_03295 [Candidatus Micrarchaeota archaeon]|nr:hypothetical protein [Candidatus Micrarchaeota archaeon]